MRMMEGNTNELPAIINPDLDSTERTAAAGEDRMYIAVLKLQRLLADRRWLDRRVVGPLPQAEHTTLDQPPLDLTPCCAQRAARLAARPRDCAGSVGE